jgi:tetratricopeptide (TPR) repeat protein
LAFTASVAFYLACYLLFYLPVMRADGVEIEERMAADPFSAEVCRQTAQLELELLESGHVDALPRLERALEEGMRRSPRSHLSYVWAGDAQLRAYRVLKRDDLLADAVKNYEKAAERYPNSSLSHAQLAWARHVAGDKAGAANAAQNALRLDELCPHEDRKLHQQVLRDSALTPLLLLPLDTTMRRLAGETGSKPASRIEDGHD